ncbi:MAG: dockerin type I repeat-containing protein [Muribaculaceae bacterium]|nr:dockerin type I repeat-containing protein [Muribaculaceae bacterium]
MKKILSLLFAAALAMTAQAQFLGWLEVGDYYNPTEIYNGSYFDMAPTNFYLAHTGVQMIYTPDLMTRMVGKEGVQIKYLNFKYHNETFEEIVRNAKVYLQEIDATEFAVNENGVKQFFDLGTLVAEGRYDIDLLETYGEDQALVIEVEEPFAYSPEKSLLVTIVMDAEDDDNCTMGSDYAAFYTSGIRGKAMTYTNNWTSFVDYAMGDDFPNATAMLGCGTNVELPVTEIGYTYERLCGDVNGDGEVNIVDAIDLINYILGSVPTPFYEVNANVNQDSEVTITDAILLINIVLNDV